MTDFSLYPLLLPQLASDSFQNVPFCSGERALQHHALLAPATPSPPQEYLPSSHPLLSLLPVQKVRFALQNFVFLVPGPIFARSTKTAPFDFSRLQHAVRQKPKKCSSTRGGRGRRTTRGSSFSGVSPEGSHDHHHRCHTTAFSKQGPRCP